MNKIIPFIILLLISMMAYVYLSRDTFELVELSERASYLNTTQQLEKEAAESVEQLIRDAEEEGMCLIVVSGYRTYEEQEKIYEEHGPKRAEEPGESEHEMGLAVDFGGCPMTDGKRDDEAERLELKKDFEELPEYDWLIENAKDYGFSRSYTGECDMIEEPWHWKYNKKGLINYK